MQEVGNRMGLSDTLQIDQAADTFCRRLRWQSGLGGAGIGILFLLPLVFLFGAALTGVAQSLIRTSVAAPILLFGI